MSLSVTSTSGAAVSFTGIASGINANEIIEAEQAPETAVLDEYQSQIGQLTDANTVWQTILADLQAIGTQVQTLQNPLSFKAMTAESSNSSAVTASASSGTPAGSYALTVTQLAQGQESISEGSVSDPTALDFGTGTLQIQIGSSQAVSVSIGTGQNSVDGIASAINAAGLGVTAQVAQTSSGTYQLFLTSNATGTTNAFTVTDKLSGGSVALGSFSTVQAAQDASLTLGSGSGAVTVTSPSNTVSSVLPGITLSLLETGSSTVTVSSDATTEATTVQNFVTAYNQLVKDINTQNTFNTSTEEPGGALFGNPLLDLISGTLADAVMNPVAAAPAAVDSLSMIGVTMNSDGTLSVDTGTLDTALQQNPQGVVTLMQGVTQAVSTALTSFDAPSTGAVPEQMTANTSQINTLTTTINTLQTQIQQEALIMQQEFTAMEQVVNEDQGLLSLLEGNSSSSSTSSTSGTSSAGSTSSGTSSTTGSETTQSTTG